MVWACVAKDDEEMYGVCSGGLQTNRTKETWREVVQKTLKHVN